MHCDEARKLPRSEFSRTSLEYTPLQGQSVVAGNARKEEMIYSQRSLVRRSNAIAREVSMKLPREVFSPVSVDAVLSQSLRVSIMLHSVTL